MAKIADFGTSSIMFASSFREDSRNRTVANPTWLAPEVIKEQGANIRTTPFVVQNVQTRDA